MRKIYFLVLFHIIAVGFAYPMEINNPLVVNPPTYDLIHDDDALYYAIKNELAHIIQNYEKNEFGCPLNGSEGYEEFLDKCFNIIAEGKPVLEKLLFDDRVQAEIFHALQDKLLKNYIVIKR